MNHLLFVAWSTGRINTLNANWANSFGLGEFVRMKSGERLALDETDEWLRPFFFSLEQTLRSFS